MRCFHSSTPAPCVFTLSSAARKPGRSSGAVAPDTLSSCVLTIVRPRRSGVPLTRCLLCLRSEVLVSGGRAQVEDSLGRVPGSASLAHGENVVHTKLFGNIKPNGLLTVYFRVESQSLARFVLAGRARAEGRARHECGSLRPGGRASCGRCRRLPPARRDSPSSSSPAFT